MLNFVLIKKNVACFFHRVHRVLVLVCHLVAEGRVEAKGTGVHQEVR